MIDRLSDVIGYVKWFSTFRGFGFLRVDKMKNDIFMHFSVLDKFGYKYVKNNDEILCDLISTKIGYSVLEIHSINGENHPFCQCDCSIHDVKNILKIEAVVKWFNPVKGYGFATTECGSDVFIHSSIIKKIGIHSLMIGQPIKVCVHKTCNGLEATSIYMSK